VRVSGVIVARALSLAVCWRLLLLLILARRHICLALLVGSDALADGVHGVSDAAVLDAGFEETHFRVLKGNEVEDCWVGMSGGFADWMTVVVVVGWCL
jgi:hypothetical protein